MASDAYRPAGASRQGELGALSNEIAGFAAAGTEASAVSRLGDLFLWDQRVDTETPTAQVEQLFLEDSALPACIIIQRGKLFGLLSRKHLTFAMSRPFGREVLLKRPVSVAGDAINTAPLKLPAQTDIAAGLKLALARPGETCFEPLLVEAADFFGILEINVLLTAQAALLEQTLKSKEKLVQDVHRAAKELKRFVDLVQRMKELEAENLKLRHTVSDLAMQNAAIRGAVTQPR
ncbi:MAG: hypothetical protein B7X08_06810 [Acidocella sp. 20-63-7]|nr:MAG: hypothetical protein B7X08_06810 [Acidocella sp. 20-63-7]HQT47032.1 hypothetical protein [Acidocella sp.]